MCVCVCVPNQVAALLSEMVPQISSSASVSGSGGSGGGGSSPSVGAAGMAMLLEGADSMEQVGSCINKPSSGTKIKMNRIQFNRMESNGIEWNQTESSQKPNQIKPDRLFVFFQIARSILDVQPWSPSK